MMNHWHRISYVEDNQTESVTRYKTSTQKWHTKINTKIPNDDAQNVRNALECICSGGKCARNSVNSDWLSLNGWDSVIMW